MAAFCPKWACKTCPGHGYVGKQLSFSLAPWILSFQKMINIVNNFKKCTALPCQMWGWHSSTVPVKKKRYLYQIKVFHRHLVNNLSKVIYHKKISKKYFVF